MSTSHQQQLPAARFRTPLLAASLGVVAVLGLAAPAANAGTDSFCSGSVLANSVCVGPTHTLTASRGTNQTYGAGCGGAYADGLYYCATPAGCHTYTPDRLRRPAIRHRSTTSKTMSGYSTWGSTDAPASCVEGTPYRVAGPLADAAADLPGVPVLDRAPESAPRAVADLFPGADASKARRFDVARGSGWVLVDPSTKQVCLAVEDPGVGYGVSCQGYGAARLRGSLSTLEDADATTAEGDLAIALVPEGSKGLTIGQSDGSSRTLPAQDGVVVAELSGRDVTVALDAADEADVTAQKWAVGRS